MTDKVIKVKAAQPPFIMLTQDCFENLNKYELPVFISLLFKANYSQESSEVKMTIKRIAEISRMCERKVYECLNGLEFTHHVLRRTNYEKMKYGHENCFLIARDYMYFKHKEQEINTPAQKDMGVQKFITPAPYAVPPAPYAVPPARNDIPIDHNLSLISSKREGKPTLQGELIREQRGSKRLLIKAQGKIEWIENNQPPAAAVPSSIITQGTAAAVPEYKEYNIKNLIEREGQANPLTIFLAKGYLERQRTMNEMCLTDKKATDAFNKKFGALDVTIEEMLIECVMYYALKPDAQYVSPHRFRAWVKRENTDIYDKKPDSLAHKLYRDLTADELKLISEYKHFKRYTELEGGLTDLQKQQAEKLIEMLESAQKMRNL